MMGIFTDTCMDFTQADSRLCHRSTLYNNIIVLVDFGYIIFDLDDPAVGKSSGATNDSGLPDMA
jgi:hypothetical protein